MNCPGRCAAYSRSIGRLCCAALSSTLLLRLVSWFREFCCSIQLIAVAVARGEIPFDESGGCARESREVLAGAGGFREPDLPGGGRVFGNDGPPFAGPHAAAVWQGHPPVCAAVSLE